MNVGSMDKNFLCKRSTFLDILHSNEQNFNLYINFYILHRFLIHLVSSLGSHSTYYVLIVPLTQERCPEDGLKKDRNMLP
jgi:hypothetical protein